MPDVSQDPYAAMLGEGQGGGTGASIGRFARRLISQRTGADLDAARAREQMRMQEGARLHEDAASAAQYGMDEYFTPERIKYGKSLGVDLTGVQSVAQSRKKLMAEDESEFAAMSGAAPPAAGARAGGTGSPTPPAPSGASPAPTGGGVVAASTGPSGGAPAAAPASGGPTPPIGPDGKPQWENHDWSAHAEAEPPEEADAYKKAQFYMNKGRRAASFGLPGADAYFKMGAMYAEQYHTLLNTRMGFNKESQLQSQSEKFQAYQTQVVQQGEDRRAKLNKDLQERNLTAGRVQQEEDAIAKEAVDVQAKLAQMGTSDPDVVKPFADALNARVDHLADVAGQANIPFDKSSLRQKLVTTTTPSWWRTALGIGPARAATIEPESEPETQSDINAEGDAATVASSPGAKSSAPVAPKKIKNLSALEGQVIPGPPGKPDLIIRNGKPEVYAPETNARR